MTLWLWLMQEGQSITPALGLQLLSTGGIGAVLVMSSKLSFKVGRILERFTAMEKRVAELERKLPHPDHFCRYAPECGSKGGA